MILTRGRSFLWSKSEFVLIDAIWNWQCGTIQVDLNLPPRLNANYIDKMVVQTISSDDTQSFFGSLERFIGILIEHYSGKLPNWLAHTSCCSNY